MRFLRPIIGLIITCLLLAPTPPSAQTVEDGPAVAPEVTAPPEPSVSPGAPARPPRPAATRQADRRITLNFKDAELNAVVQFISEVTGKSFILDADQRQWGKVTLISPLQVTVDEAYEIFQTMLNIKNFTIVPSGRVYKIVQTQLASQTTVETVRDSAPPGDRVVTRIIPLQYVDVNGIVQVISPLVTKGSPVIAYPATNTLIVIDSHANIERLLEIIRSLDVETVDTVLEIIPMRYASAEIMAKNLAQVVADRTRQVRRAAPARGQAQVQQVQAEATAVKIIPDSRTNALIVISDPQTMADIKVMIEALDVEIPKGSGKINVYYLKYADAENVASVLTAISKSAGTRPRPGQPQPAARATGATEASVEFEEPVQITADKTTNSLVIIASPQDYEILRDVIEKLDIRRPQVLVDALIVEMSFEKALELGVEWRTTDDPRGGDLTGFASTNFGTIGNVAVGGPLAVPQGLALGVIKGTVTFAGREFLNVGALLRALQTDSDVNVLSSPHLITTDNEEAEIVVSDNIPFKTSEKFDSQGNPISTFEYRDVGLTLRFTPQINEDNFVRLRLFQETSQILSTATGGSINAPSTTRRSARTTVVVQDQTTVVIGGLVSDDTQMTASSVPCLGDLPLLGYLFRSSRQETRKKNLLIFLTPRIVTSMAKLEEVTEDKRFLYEEQVTPTGAPPLQPAQKLEHYLDRLKGEAGQP
ncbi:MAG: type II secretion system secretin GspD [Deferrisomatales bacterium]|nr:type II secretion system secretin GspD [Deferrisomatales bacterium]